MDEVLAEEPAAEEAAPPKEGATKPLVPKKGSTEVAGVLTNLFDNAFNARASFNELWTTCVAFFEGQQWVRWNPLSFQLQYNTRVPFHMKPIVENRVKPTVKQAAAIISQEDPLLSVPPANTDEDERNRAEAATAILGKIQKTLETPRYNRLLAKWMCITGTALLESEWDALASPWKPKMGFTAEGWMPLKDPKTGEQLYDKPQGALRRNLYTSFEIFPDPGSTGPDDADYCFLVQSMDPEEVYRRCGIRAKKAVGDVASSSGTGGSVAGRVGQILQRAFGLFGEGFAYSTTAAGLSRAVDVIKFYQAPCEEAKGGRLVIMIDGQVVYDDVMATRGYIRYPFSVFNFDEHGKRWFSSGIVQDLLDIQREMNRTVTRYAETLALMGNPRILSPRGIGINRESWINRPGLVLEYDIQGDSAQHVPKVMEGVTMPRDVFQHLDRLERSFMRVSGIEDALLGASPTADASGKAILALQGKGVQRLTPAARAMQEAWAKVGRYELFLAGQNWPENMQIAAVGRNMKPQLIDFHKADFSSPLEVVVENGTALPQDPVSRQQLLDRMFGPGGPMVTLPVELRRLYLSLSKHGADLMTFYEQENTFENRTRLQIRAALRGERQIVNYNDDHKTARRVLSMAMCGQEFLDAPDAMKALVVDLDEQHAMWDQSPKDEQGICLPPGQGQLGVVPGMPPVPAPPNPQQVQAAAGMPPTAPPAPSAPKMQPA